MVAGSSVEVGQSARAAVLTRRRIARVWCVRTARQRTGAPSHAVGAQPVLGTRRRVRVAAVAVRISKARVVLADAADGGAEARAAVHTVGDEEQVSLAPGNFDGLRQRQVAGEDLPLLLVLVGVGIQPEVVVRLGVERQGLEVEAERAARRSNVDGHARLAGADGRNCAKPSSSTAPQL